MFYNFFHLLYSFIYYNTKTMLGYIVDTASFSMVGFVWHSLK